MTVFDKTTIRLSPSQSHYSLWNGGTSSNLRGPASCRGGLCASPSSCSWLQQSLDRSITIQPDERQSSTTSSIPPGSCPMVEASGKHHAATARIVIPPPSSSSTARGLQGGARMASGCESRRRSSSSTNPIRAPPTISRTYACRRRPITTYTASHSGEACKGSTSATHGLNALINSPPA